MVEGYLAAFDTALAAPQPCTRIMVATINTAHGPTTLEVIHLNAEPPGDDSLWTSVIERSAAAIGPGIDAIGTARLPRAITVLLRNRIERIDFDPGPGVDIGIVHANTSSVDPESVEGGECFVSFFKGDRAIALSEFIHALAHEVFHCAQLETWPDAMVVDHLWWWREGSAEYFADLIQPGATGRSADLQAEFERMSRRRSLVDMQYEAVVFFYWIGNRGGPEGVGAFLTHMATANGTGAQLDALRGQVPLDDWTQFIEAWLDGNVTSPGGDTVSPMPAVNGTKTFRRSDQLAMNSRAYSIPRWRVTFAREKVFELSLRDATGVSRTRMKIDGWAEPPEEVNTCTEEKSYLIYSATVEDGARAILSVETDADTTHGNCCLIGRWSPTQETLEGFAATGMQIGAVPIAAAGARLSCGYDSGGWVLSFDDQDHGTIEYEGNTNVCTVTARNGAVKYVETRNGTIGFDWEIIGDGAGIAHYTENSLIWNLTMHIGPITQSMPGGDAGPSVPSNGFAFTCEGDDLTIQGLYGISHNEATHIRIAE